jgi:hypothetical protein
VTARCLLEQHRSIQIKIAFGNHALLACSALNADITESVTFLQLMRVSRTTRMSSPESVWCFYCSS